MIKASVACAMAVLAFGLVSIAESRLSGSCLRASPLRRGTAQTDLDAFMAGVLERRDENWKKLQQYLLDERERVELKGPSSQILWGEDRTYMWYIRDGFFVRSPLVANGVSVPERGPPPLRGRVSSRGPRNREKKPDAETQVPAARRADSATRDLGGSADADATAAVHRLRVLPSLQVRGGEVRARRPRDAGRRRRAADRVLPGAAVLARTGDPAETRGRGPRRSPRRRRGRDGTAHEQGVARHALGRARLAPDRQVHLRQRELRLSPGVVAPSRQRHQGDDDDGTAVSRRVAAARRGHAVRRACSRSGLSISGTGWTTSNYREAATSGRIVPGSVR